MKIINLTQHKATPEQIVAGVVDLEEEQRAELKVLLTFDELPSRYDIQDNADNIANIAIHSFPDMKKAMIGGAPFLMGALVKELIEYDIIPLYAFSKREIILETAADGSVTKTAVFRHLGFVGESTYGK